MSIIENIKILLSGNDLRSLGKSKKIINLIKHQNDFDVLFNFIYSEDRTTVMKTIDCIEKITRPNPHYLDKYTNQIIRLCDKTLNIELKWHLAQIISRLSLTNEEINKLVIILKKWILDKKESKMVRVNALQSLFEINNKYSTFKPELNEIISKLKKENIPSLNVRIRKIGF